MSDSLVSSLSDQPMNPQQLNLSTHKILTGPTAAAAATATATDAV